MSKFYLSSSRYLTVLLFLITTLAWSQSRTISGKVTAVEDGSAIPGVNVVEKGTNNGTATDVDGNYSLNVGNNSTVVFSFVGYSTQEVVVGNQTSISVQLTSDVQSLSEVVVVGYGTQEKKEITGAVASIDTKDFNRGNINDPSQLLQGKVAGLSIYNKGGDPNQSATIRLRGLSTIGQNTGPLIVVDGVIGASLDNIDPNDIESVNVLKDGSAAAIYGSRGSSGVILVTTKRGSKTGLQVSFNSYIAASTIFKKIPIMTPGEYIANGGNDLGSQTDWVKQVTQTGVSQVNNLAIGGGNQNTTFRLSANFRNVDGILRKSGFDQVNTRANLTHSALNNKLKFDLNMAFTNRNQDFSFPEAMRYATLFNPTAPIFRPGTDTYYQGILFDSFNPVAIINQNSATGMRRNLNYSAKIDYNVVKNLTLTMNLAQQFNNSTRDEYYNSKSYYRGLNRNGLARKNADNDQFTLFEAYGNYTKTINRLDLSFSAGYSYQEQQNQGFFVELGDFPSDALTGNALQNAGDRLSGIATNTNISSYQSPKNKIIAGFARINLMFDNAIYFNASVRREGSTKLGENNKWGTFPALGAGVDINHYLQLPKFSLLKFRAGYGVTGSLPSDAGLSKDQYQYKFDGGGAVTKLVTGNPDLKWEQKAELNLGIDFAVGKLSGSVDAYDRTVKDVLLQVNLQAGPQAGQNQWQNAAGLNTKGIELALNYNVQLGQVNWTPGIVVSHYQTILKKYVIDRGTRADFGAPGQNGTNIDLVQVGKPIGTIWGPVFDHVSVGGSDGANQAQDPASETYDPTKGVAAGAPVFKDLNGDGRIDANPADALLPSADMKKLGQGIPTAEIGWSNRLTFKNWDFNVFFRGAFGHSLVNQFRAFYEPIDPGAINSYNRVITDKAVAGLTSAQYSSLYVEKADFVKLDNLTIGYNFKLSSNYVKNLRLYVTGQNLFQITSYTGIDPEPVLADFGSQENGAFPPSTADVLAPGIDRRNNYFTSRTFTFGLNVGF